MVIDTDKRMVHIGSEAVELTKEDLRTFVVPC